MRAVRELATRVPYRFSISDMSFISASTAAIFSADEGWGRPNPRNDIFSDGGSGRDEVVVLARKGGGEW